MTRILNYKMDDKKDNSKEKISEGDLIKQTLTKDYDATTLNDLNKPLPKKIQETVLDQFINKNLKNESKITKVSTFLQPDEIVNLKDDLGKSIEDLAKSNLKQNKYLSVRNISTYDIKEYDTIKLNNSKNFASQWMNWASSIHCYL